MKDVNEDPGLLRKDKKFCTSPEVVHIVIHWDAYITTGAGFCPSTVCPRSVLGVMGLYGCHWLLTDSIL